MHQEGENMDSEEQKMYVALQRSLHDHMKP